MTKSNLNKLSTFHTKNLRRILMHVLAGDNLQSTSSRPLQPRQHGNHHTKVMETDQTHNNKRVRLYLSHNSHLSRHQRGSRRGGNPRTPGTELWKGSSRPSMMHGGPFRSWSRTDKSGIPLLLSYMPDVIIIMGMNDEWNDLIINALVVPLKVFINHGIVWLIKTHC